MKLLLHHPLECNAQRFADKTALICHEQRLSFAQIDEAANRLANAFLALGLKKHDRVAVYLENSVESIISIYGILKAGGIFVIIHPQVKARKLDFILNDCGVRLLVTETSLLPQVPCAGVPERVLLVEKPITTPLPIVEGYAVDSFWEALSAQDERHPGICIDETDLCSLIYTSGSTANPKGVMLTHRNMRSASASIISYLENRSDDVVINFSPLSFDYGLYNCLMPIEFGGSVVLEKSFLYPYQLVGQVRREGITGLPLVPPIIALMLKFKNMSSEDFPSVRYITSTGQPLPPEHSQRLQALFPRTRIFAMYGLTECKRVAYLPPEELANRPTSVGKAMPNVTVEILDEQEQPITTPGTIGELVIRGANVMQGYWNCAQETAQRLKPGLHPQDIRLFSGDLFYQDAEGFLYFVSRKDDLIKTSGERVSPQEVENVLCQIPQVIEAAVIAVPHDTLGHALQAFLVLEPGASLEYQIIIDHCAANLEPYMIPKVLKILAELPKTSSGKIDKKPLRLMAEKT